MKRQNISWMVKEFFSLFFSRVIRPRICKYVVIFCTNWYVLSLFAYNYCFVLLRQWEGMLSFFLFAPLVSWHRLQGTLIKSGKEFEARDTYVKWPKNGVKYFRPRKVGELRLSEFVAPRIFTLLFSSFIVCFVRITSDLCRNIFDFYSTYQGRLLEAE